MRSGHPGGTERKGSDMGHRGSGYIVVFTSQADDETTNEFMDGNYCAIKIKHSLKAACEDR
jgi:hypothetical protein